MTSKAGQQTHYEFGANWLRFLETQFSPERVREAASHLLTRLQRPHLRGLTFLDVGCGSGLHSLAAWLAGATEVVSFDRDQQSMQATTQLWKAAGSPSNWSLHVGSILDTKFVASLPCCDIVYAWGSLHHTGDLWSAVDQAVSRLKADGILYLAIYSPEVYVNPGPEIWKSIKQRYARSGRWGRWCWEWWYAGRFQLLPELIRGRNPLRAWQKVSGGRGMEFWTDVRDWLGGWPMEFASVPETLQYLQKRHGCGVINLATGDGCSEYLFQRESANNWWTDSLRQRARRELVRPFVAQGGQAYLAEIPELAAESDSISAPRKSRWFLWEDGHPLSIQHATPRQIARYGGGRFLHRGTQLLFSTSDQTNPNHNGRRYELVQLERAITPEWQDWPALPAAVPAHTEKA